jgi:hypothetical protein
MAKTPRHLRPAMLFGSFGGSNSNRTVAWRGKSGKATGVFRAQRKYGPAIGAQTNKKKRGK